MIYSRAARLAIRLLLGATAAKHRETKVAVHLSSTAV